MEFLKDSAFTVAMDYPHSIANNTYIEKLMQYLKETSREFISEDELHTLIHEHLQPILLSNHLLRSMKSFVSTYDEQLKKRPDMNEHIEFLKCIQQPEQRTPEWYRFRYNHITASNAWKAYSTKEKVKNQLIYDKCKEVDIIYSGLSETPMSWGHKYEPITIQLYETFNDTIVSEFGCIEHANHTFIAASPDGIVTGKNNFGRMIEVKNVVSRVINGIPKEDYYIQMQVQMEVCNLDECDFVETKFVEYDSYNDFIQDGSGCFTQENNYKGIIKVYIKDNETYVYDYMDLNCNNFEKWLDEENMEYEWFKNVYWKLDVYSCVYVPRCKLWFEKTFEDIQNVWNIILKERISGDYVLRKPVKRKKKEIIHLNACLIDNVSMSIE
jgi:putative phage-type endonuclease